MNASDMITLLAALGYSDIIGDIQTAKEVVAAIDEGVSVVTVGVQERGRVSVVVVHAHDRTGGRQVTGSGKDTAAAFRAFFDNWRVVHGG